MTTEFKLPELGENIEAGDVVSVLVSVGDEVQRDQPVLELETDKATIEVPSLVAGTIKEIHVKEGDKAQVGQVILTVEEAGPAPAEEESTPPEKAEKGAPAEKSEATAAEEPAPAEEEESGGAAPPEQEAAPVTTIEFKLPELGENIEAGDVVSVLVSVGDEVQRDQPVLELETDKATIEVPSTVAGTVKEIHVQEGEKAQVGQVVLTVEGVAEGPEKARPAPQRPRPAKTEPAPTAKEAAKAGKGKAEDVTAALSAQERTPLPDQVVEPEPDRSAVPAAPNVRRLAREIGVDITEVSGSGPGGRVSMADVKKRARDLNTGAIASGFDGRIGTVSLPDFTKWGAVERVSMSNIRRTTAERVSQAWLTIPHVTQFDKADIGELEELRKRFSGKVEEAGGKLTITAILLKIVAAALKEFPQCNASVDMAQQEIIYKKYYHIGVAVDTDRGLLVPVIRDVDKKNIIELAVELGEVAEKARNKKLSLEDMQGGTFTITNLGGIGGTNFTPIVNAPEVAILGVARGRVEPVYKNGQFEPRLMLPLSLSYDHRLVDGADGIRFLRQVVEYLEQPFLTSLQGW